MGYEPRHSIPISTPLDAPDITARLTELEHLRKEIQSSLDLTNQIMQQWTKGTFQEYEKGQKVWLEGTNLKGLHPKAKLGPKHYGPFTIQQKLSPVVYRLQLPPKWKIHPVFHAGLLHPYQETKLHGENYLRPPPEIIKNQEEFEIEWIIDAKTVGK